MNREDTAPRWLEPITAVILGAAAVLTALAAYLSAVQAGDEDQARAASIEFNAEAHSLTNAATQIRAADQAMFAAWAETSFGEEEALTEYLMTLMRPELATAVGTWADSEADTPFEEASYVIQEGLDAEAAFKKADDATADAELAAEKGDGYDKSTVFLALTLFFAGIATTFRRPVFASTLLGISALTLMIGSVQLLAA